MINIFNLLIRFIVQSIDSQLENGLSCKDICLMVVDLVADAMKFITYSFFFCLVFVYYGLPIHIVREVWISFLTFQQKLGSFMKYLQLNHNLDKRFDDATEEELTAAGACLVCMETMTAGKKLPCSHCFHLECLRSWLQHQQLCPLCRAEIPVSYTRTRTAASIRAERAEERINQQPGLAAEGRIPGEAHAADPDAATDRTGSPVGDETGSRTRVFERDFTPDGLSGRRPRSVDTSHEYLPEGEQRSNDDPNGSQTPEFPAFFKIVSRQACDVYAAPSSASIRTRTLQLGIVIFAVEKTTEESGDWWLHIPDGWVMGGRGEGLTHSAEEFVKNFKCSREEALNATQRFVSTQQRLNHRRLLPESVTSFKPSSPRVNTGIPAVHIRGRGKLNGSSGGVRVTWTRDRHSVSQVRENMSSDSNQISSDPILRKLAALEEELADMNQSVQIFLQKINTTQRMIGSVKEEYDCMCRAKCNTGEMITSKTDDEDELNSAHSTSNVRTEVDFGIVTSTEVDKSVDEAMKTGSVGGSDQCCENNTELNSIQNENRKSMRELRAKFLSSAEAKEETESGRSMTGK